ncbi:SDR family NAD(P)-dependent oxidoreductase [Mucilaginibacter angelicae]|uniref:SDR family NAD(P)-dependent oxidoreductase n=1 Tax=Mucilaginibacter angelicae TaxID=869718 RepID=A0ABV6L1F8_9SPHI
MEVKSNQYTGFEVAIIGIACRVSEAETWREFWDNLKNSRESLLSFETQTLNNNDKREERHQKKIVGVGSSLKRKEFFDSAFFDYTPEEAMFLSPQNRIFHECVWEALEDAGYDPEQTSGSIGIYSGASDDLNWRVHSTILNHQNQAIPEFVLKHLNNKDFMNSQVSYKLNLKGPSITTQTACSSSLVAVHMACKALLFGETNLAIAGGVSLSTDILKGYEYQDGSILSADGHCRSFDERSSGTVGGEGIGMVVLKKLKNAIADRDHIYAIIKGSAVNNDGRRKVGYTAPSIDGQIECIKLAQKISKVESASIGYIETHGTGTKLGDSIEITALNTAFKDYEGLPCPIGAVKTNIGHLDAAAGVIGLIKTALSLKFKQITPTLHFEKADKLVDFQSGPFYVNTELAQWDGNGTWPLRAGINSFGVGGTNAHVILEEPPVALSNEPGSDVNILVFSAKTDFALNGLNKRLADFVKENEHVDLSDMAYTMAVGRKAFPYRKAIVFEGREQLLASLNIQSPESQSVRNKLQKIVFMFPGQGSQYSRMGLDLYQHNKLFARYMDEGFSILNTLVGKDLKEVIFSPNCDLINETRYAQPLIFLLEYSLAQVMIAYAGLPDFMLGHSIGEYVAACISGVIGFNDALKLVVKRGELMYNLPQGSMLSLSMGEDQARKYLNDRISLAAVNGPEQVVLSGDDDAIDEVVNLLAKDNLVSVRLRTSHAFHSFMIDPITDLFEKEIGHVELNRPGIPFISNLTGRLIDDEDAMLAKYWAKHMRQAVNFSGGIKFLLEQVTNPVFVELGAGHSLSSLLNQHVFQNKKHVVVNVLPSVKQEVNDHSFFLNSLGKLWTKGITVKWNVFWEHERRQRISLPTYCFDETKYTAEVDPYGMLLQSNNASAIERKSDVGDYFYGIGWKQLLGGADFKADLTDARVMIFSDNHGLTELLMASMSLDVNQSVIVKSGEYYNQISQNEYCINPLSENELKKLFDELQNVGFKPTKIIYLWSFEPGEPANLPLSDLKINYETILNIARYNVLAFPLSVLQLEIVSNGWYKVLGDESIKPVKSLSLGIVKVLPLEFANISCRAIELLDLSADSVSSLIKELNRDITDQEVAVRGMRRYGKFFEKINLGNIDDAPVLKYGGTYLITGAGGGLGKLIAEFLAESFHANLILIGRSNVKSDFISRLTQLGAKVIYIQSDVANQVEVSLGIRNAEDVFGKVNGVVHAAGLADTAGVILNRTIEDDIKVFEAKITGTDVLHTVFERTSLDFFVNFSSQNASLPNVGQVAYVGANLVLDAVAERGLTDYPNISIQWSTVRDTGMATDLSKRVPVSELNSFLKFCVNPEEVVPVFLRALHLKIPTLIISTSDFVQLFSIRERALKQENHFLNQETETTGNRSQRPELSTNYVEATTETEARMKQLFEDFFGIEDVGAQDSFFELGGDSLKAMVFLQKVNKVFNVEVAIKELFEANTVIDISGLVDERLWLARNIAMDNEIIL